MQLFHQLFLAQRPSNLTPRFRILICQPKQLYSIALLSSLCAPWPTRAFWHCFASSTAVSWLQFCHIGQVHRVFSSQWVLTRHWFNCAVMFGVVSLLSRKLATDENVLYSSYCFWSTSLIFGFVLSRFLMSPNSIIHIIHCSSLNFYFWY